MDYVINKQNESMYQPTTPAHALSLSGANKIQLDEGATIGATGGGNGIVGLANATAEMTLDGTVMSTNGTAIATSAGNQTVQVNSTGVIFGSKGGIILNATPNGTGSSSVVNDGSVMSLTGKGIWTQNGNNSITNTGTIIAYEGIWAGSLATLGSNSVFNTGNIIGTQVGVFALGDQSIINNSGTIRVTGSTASGIILFGESSGTMTVHNTGTIESTTKAIIGFSQADVISNKGTIIGLVELAAGNDLYDSRGGTITGGIVLGIGDDTLLGGGGAETVSGGGGNDLLDGGLGDDVLGGDLGTDTARFSGAAGAEVDLTLGFQNTGYGLDLLIGIENLEGGGGADLFTGDGGLNTLTGHAGNDTLNGGLGDDVLDGGIGADTAAFSGTTGATVDLSVTAAQATGHGLDTLIEIENLIGSDGGDNFTGSLGNNILEGGLGNDTLNGGSGVDMAAFTGTVGAKVDLTKAGAQSTGYGSDTFLGIEGLSGGAGADRFIGNSAVNTLIGNAGKDTLNGGKGNDKLTGGTGADIFVFNTKLSATTNVDAITDFRRVDDTFQLENAIFKKLTNLKTLDKSFFVLGTKAKASDDHIIYDKAKGALYYDADGSGKGAAIKFAQITKKTAIDYKDFYII